MARQVIGQACPCGEVEQVARPDLAEPRMFPSRERFGTDHVATIACELRLEADLYLPQPQCQLELIRKFGRIAFKERRLLLD